MRLAVISDTHGKYSALERFILLEKDCSDLLIHLGDGWREFCIAKECYPEVPFLFVRGNNDYDCREPHTRVFECGGINVLATHGHRFHVKSDGLTELETEAEAEGARLVLFGHTHEALKENRGGIRFLNPGSAGYAWGAPPSFAVADILDDGSVVCNIAQL